MKKFTFLFLLLSSFFLQVRAQQTIDVPVAGALGSVTSSPATITGTIDARDFKFMRDEMTVLSVLDLSAVSIARYEGVEGTIDVGIPMSFTYPANVIPQMAFSRMGDNGGSQTLTSVVLPENIVGIDGSAFADAQALESLVIPALVENFGANAFAGCDALSSITSLRVEPVTIAQSVFSGVNKNSCVLYVPYGSASAYSTTQYWSEFTNIQELAEHSGTYIPEAGTLASVLIGLGLNPATLVELTLSGNIDARDFNPNYALEFRKPS